MQKCPNYKDRALAEVYTMLLIAYENYKLNAITKSDYESIKRTCLFDKEYLRYMMNLDDKYSDFMSFADPDKMALDVLNELAYAGAITDYEYYTQKERHYLH